MDNPNEYILIKSIDDGWEKLESLKKKWEKVKPNNDHKFPEYIDDRIEVLEDILNSELPIMEKFSRTNSEINIINAFIKKPHLGLKEIFFYTPINEKLRYFTMFHKHFSDKEFWRKLSMIYTGQDFQKLPHQIYKLYFNSNRPYREELMDEEEKAHYNKLPDIIKAYRCMSKEEKKREEFGFSWTLSKDVAQFFVDRNNKIYQKEHVIYEKLLHKSDIIAYLNERDEEEILYLPQ